MRYRLIARLFTRAASVAEARQQQARLLAALAGFAPAPAGDPVPYWKIPGLFEHDLRLAPATPAAFEAVLALAGAGWHVTRDEECSAVWNPVPGGVFLLPEVHWAEILLNLSSDATP